ncbi:MAG: hypothetical protein KAS39_04520 [Actinomycetia bacterium]|nr:hypothetical protein [Actinomycetes bacterium]
MQKENQTKSYMKAIINMDFSKAEARVKADRMVEGLPFNIKGTLTGRISSAGPPVQDLPIKSGDPKLFCILIGTSLHITDETNLDQARGQAIKAIQAGKSVTWYNGVTQWITKVPVLNNIGPDVPPSDRYEWDDTGIRILCKHVMNTIRNGELISQNTIGKSYLYYHDIMGE